MRNPIRRSRKIGVTQGGRVKGGRPREKDSRLFTRTVWTKLSFERTEPGPALLRENPAGNAYHPVSLDDCVAVLARMPGKETRPVRAIVLRRKPEIDKLRMVLARQRYRCVILNAWPRDNRTYWRGDPGPKARRSLGRWARDWRTEDGWTVLQWTPEEVRRFYLYDLLLHEVGHLHHPHLRERTKREAFAENYALEWAERLGELPS